MATIARVTTWSSGQVLKSADLNGEFNNVTNYLNNADSGAATWNRVLATNATSVPLIVNNSTGTQDIADFQVNGSNKVTINGTGVITSTVASGNSLVIDTSTLVVDSTNHRVGIVNATPGANLSVGGSAKNPVVVSTSNASNNNYVTFITSGASSSIGLQMGLAGAGNMSAIRGGADLRFFVGGLDGTVLDGTANVLIGSNGGLQLGAPTSGDKGNGTMNCAADIYKNNTAYINPDYVLERWATGKMEKFKSNPGAADYPGILPIDDLEKYMVENLDLPRVKSLHVDGGGQGVFARGDIALEKLEEAHIYIVQLHNRLKKLEGGR